MKALTHTQAQEWLQQAADGLLDEAQRQQLDAHLKSCPQCRAYAKELSLLETMLREGLLAHWGQPQLPVSAEKTLLKKRPGPRPPRLGGGLLALGGLAGAALLAWALWGGGGTPPSPTATPQTAANQSAGATLTVTPGATASASPTLTATATPGELTLLAVPLQTVNCREGNGSQFDIADTLFADTEYSPLGRGPDNLWVQFRGPVNPVRCWVYIENITLLLGGQPVEIEDVPTSLLPYLAYPTPTPSATPRPQCSDGLDNDGDGAIDMQDRECKDPSDDNEAN